MTRAPPSAVVAIAMALGCGGGCTSLLGIDEPNLIEADGGGHDATMPSDSPSVDVDGPASSSGGGGDSTTHDANPDANPNPDAGRDAQPGPRVWTSMNLPGPPPRHSARLAYDDASQTVVLVGGRNADDAGRMDLGDAWEWNGTGWTQLSLTGGPGATRSFGLAYDGSRRTLVLAASFSPGEVFDWSGGSAWAQESAGDTSLDAQNAFGFAFDGTQTVLFGGRVSDGGNGGQTWGWNGQTWTSLSPSSSPSARAALAMAFDSARKKIVLFGGVGSGPLNDTWEFDGTSWTQAQPTESPSPREGACMTYDVARGVAVLFGGSNATTDFSDTWLYDGTRWTLGPTGPPAMRACSIAYDAASDQIVLFGGASGGNRSVTSATWIYQ
jgi:hypothetical protein